MARGLGLVGSVFVLYWLELAGLELDESRPVFPVLAVYTEPSTATCFPDPHSHSHGCTRETCSWSAVGRLQSNIQIAVNRG